MLTGVFTMGAVLAAGPGPGPEAPEIRFGIIDPPVVAQKDITISAPTSNTRTDLKPLECSGIAWLGDRLLLLSDRHEHLLFTVPLDLGAPSIGDVQTLHVIRNEQDLLEDGESLTIRALPRGGWMAYAMSSLSNDRAQTASPKRRHLLRCAVSAQGRIDAARVRVLSADRVRELLSAQLTALGVRPYRAFYADYPGPDKNTYRWGNVEGLAFTPDGRFLLGGMRNPVVAGRAILFALSDVDAAFDAADPARIKLQDVFLLDLGGRGVSDLAWDAVTRGYLIAAARSNGPKRDDDRAYPPASLDSALFWWSGRRDEAPVLVARVPGMNVEAVCRLGASRFIAFATDEGDESESRPARQSTLTVMEFTGVKQVDR